MYKVQLVKILSFNTGYFLGYTGTPFDYLKNPLKSFKGSKTEYNNLDEFLSILEAEEPDFVLTQEVDGGSIRTSTESQHQYIASRISKEYDSKFNTKYRGILFPRAPMLRYMGNSVFFKQELLKTFTKYREENLVQEIKLEDFSIFSLHLSTIGRWIRKQQINELAALANNRQDYIIAGDLNLHQGTAERNYLEKKLENPVLSPGKTFPAENPTRKLDLVASSENIEINNLQDLGTCFSDHRPISFEANL